MPENSAPTVENTPAGVQPYRGHFSDPLATGGVGALFGAAIGGAHAPKGKLLKYLLGGAGIGSVAGATTSLGRNMGQYAANHVSDKYQLTGNSEALAQLGLPISGIIGGGLLSLPVIHRINEELEHNPEARQRKQEKTAAYKFGKSIADNLSTLSLGNSSAPAQNKLMTSGSGMSLPPMPKSPPPTYSGGNGYTGKTPSWSNLANNMAANSGRVGNGILSTAAGSVGALGGSVAALGNSMWNAVTPKSMNTSDNFTAGISDGIDASGEFALNGAQDVYGGLGGDTNYQTQNAWNQMERAQNDSSVSPALRTTSQISSNVGYGAMAAAQALANPAKAGLGYAALGTGRFGSGLQNMSNVNRGAKTLATINNVDTVSGLGQMGNSFLNAAQ
jgi:hypothetical protein